MFSLCQLYFPAVVEKLYAATPESLSDDSAVNSISPFAHSSVFPVTVGFEGFVLSILSMVTVDMSAGVFSTASRTYTYTVPFTENVLLLLSCQLYAPGVVEKLYADELSPLCKSSAPFTASVTSLLVHDVGFPVTPLAVGAVLSIFSMVCVDTRRILLSASRT